MDTEYQFDWEVPVTVGFNWSAGDPGSYDTPPDPAHAEDITVELAGQDITHMIPAKEMELLQIHAETVHDGKGQT